MFWAHALCETWRSYVFNGLHVHCTKTCQWMMSKTLGEANYFSEQCPCHNIQKVTKAMSRQAVTRKPYSQSRWLRFENVQLRIRDLASAFSVAYGYSRKRSNKQPWMLTATWFNQEKCLLLSFLQFYVTPIARSPFVARKWWTHSNNAKKACKIDDN